MDRFEEQLADTREQIAYIRGLMEVRCPADWPPVWD